MAEVLVRTPVEGFSGEVIGVIFENGQAIVDDEANPRALAYFQEAGYKLGEDIPEQMSTPVPPEDPEDPSVDEPEDVDVPGMPGARASRAEVAEFAESLGIDSESKTIPQLRELIKAELSK